MQKYYFAQVVIYKQDLRKVLNFSLLTYNFDTMLGLLSAYAFLRYQNEKCCMF